MSSEAAPAQYDHLKQSIYALVASAKRGRSINDLLRDYRDMFGKKLEPRAYGFGSIDDLLASMSDRIRIDVDNRNGQTLYPVYNSSSRHMQKMINANRSKVSRVGGLPQSQRSPKYGQAVGARRLADRKGAFANGQMMSSEGFGFSEQRNGEVIHGSGACEGNKEPKMYKTDSLEERNLKPKVFSTRIFRSKNSQFRGAQPLESDAASAYTTMRPRKRRVKKQPLLTEDGYPIDGSLSQSSDTDTAYRSDQGHTGQRRQRQFVSATYYARPASADSYRNVDDDATNADVSDSEKPAPDSAESVCGSTTVVSDMSGYAPFPPPQRSSVIEEIEQQLLAMLSIARENEEKRQGKRKDDHENQNRTEGGDMGSSLGKLDASPNRTPTRATNGTLPQPGSGLASVHAASGSKFWGAGSATPKVSSTPSAHPGTPLSYAAEQFVPRAVFSPAGQSPSTDSKAPAASGAMFPPNNPEALKSPPPPPVTPPVPPPPPFWVHNQQLWQQQTPSFVIPSVYPNLVFTVTPTWTPVRSFQVVFLKHESLFL